MYRDNWEYRSDKLICGTCIWFIAKKRLDNKVYEGQPNLGRCRRHAPVICGFPVVFGTDWCGDHKIDENKI